MVELGKNDVPRLCQGEGDWQETLEKLPRSRCLHVLLHEAGLIGAYRIDISL